MSFSKSSSEKAMRSNRLFLLLSSWSWAILISEFCLLVMFRHFNWNANLLNPFDTKIDNGSKTLGKILKWIVNRRVQCPQWSHRLAEWRPFEMKSDDLIRSDPIRSDPIDRSSCSPFSCPTYKPAQIVNFQIITLEPLHATRSYEIWAGRLTRHFECMKPPWNSSIEHRRKTYSARPSNANPNTLKRPL
jgi:hypothetical protein